MLSLLSTRGHPTQPADFATCAAQGGEVRQASVTSKGLPLQATVP